MGNQIEKLPNIPIFLEHFDCSNNKLKELPYLPEGMLQLICSHNQITNIEKLPKHLTVLDCEGNRLDKLPSFDKDIKFINYENNPINNPVKLPIKFKLFKLNPNESIPADVRKIDHLEILPDCFDYEIQKDVRSSAFMNNPNNILIRLYGSMYGISRTKLLEYSHNRDKVYRDIEDSNKTYIKLIMDKFVSLFDFEKFCNPSYSVYILSRTMDMGHFQNTVKFQTRYEEKFAIHPYSLARFIETEF
jgi:Leucine-rich repeat (LRR) protein